MSILNSFEQREIVEDKPLANRVDKSLLRSTQQLQEGYEQYKKLTSGDIWTFKMHARKIVRDYAPTPVQIEHFCANTSLEGYFNGGYITTLIEKSYQRGHSHFTIPKLKPGYELAYVCFAMKAQAGKRINVDVHADVTGGFGSRSVDCNFTAYGSVDTGADNALHCVYDFHGTSGLGIGERSVGCAYYFRGESEGYFGQEARQCEFHCAQPDLFNVVAGFVGTGSTFYVIGEDGNSREVHFDGTY